MRRLIFCCLLLICWPLAAAAYPAGLFASPLQGKVPPPLRTIQKQFEQVQVVELQFKQAKYLQELKQPLISRGVLTIAPALGVDWRVNKPFESEWTVTRDGRVLKGPNNGATAAVANLLMGVFSADVDQLKSLFRIDWKQQSASWWLGLKPRKQRLQKAITAIVVAGAAHVQQVEVDAADGDRTVIKFTGRTTQDLTPAVQKLFDSE